MSLRKQFLVCLILSILSIATASAQQKQTTKHTPNYGSIFFESPTDGFFYAEKIVDASIGKHSNDQDIDVLKIKVASGKIIPVNERGSYYIGTLLRFIEAGYDIDIGPCFNFKYGNGISSPINKLEKTVFSLDRCLTTKRSRKEGFPILLQELSFRYEEDFSSPGFKISDFRGVKPVNLNKLIGTLNWELISSPADKCIPVWAWGPPRPGHRSHKSRYHCIRTEFGKYRPDFQSPEKTNFNMVKILDVTEYTQVFDSFYHERVSSTATPIKFSDSVLDFCAAIGFPKVEVYPDQQTPYCRKPSMFEVD